jgi:hypothetical protein
MPPFVEPPMAWTGGEDIPSAEVELAFPSLSEAIGYAERQGLTYHISAFAEPHTKSPVERLYPVRERQPSDGSAGSSRAEVGRVTWLDSKHLNHGQCTDPVLPDLEQALVSPAIVFDKPEEVVRHPLLSYNCKREILLRWAWDEHLIEIAQGEGMPAQSSTRLDEVKAALLLLGEDWHPHPAAPAAFAIRIEQAEPGLAA